MIREDDDWIKFDEEVERGWREYMKEFELNVFPMFQERNISFVDALKIWGDNQMLNKLEKIQETLDSEN